MKTSEKIGIAIAVAASLAIAISAPLVHRANYRREPTFDSTLRLPVKLRVSPHMWSSNASDVREAVSLWNAAARCTAFVIVADDADVRLAWDGDDGPCGGLALDAHGGGSTWYCNDGTRDIRMRRLEENAAVRIGHELGHALGQRVHDEAGILSTSVEASGQAYVTERDTDELRRRCP